MENQRSVGKKSASKPEKNKVKKQTATNKKSTESQSRKTAQKAIKKSEKNKRAEQKMAQKNPEKAQNNTLKAAPLSQASKNVIVPECQDNQVTRVLSDAFHRQGKVMKTPMTVKNLSQMRETQYYPQQGIRSCYARVETTGKTYQTNYSVILNGGGFFVQVENAQAVF
ncbi:hypothetical protein BKK49_03270 [Rodentibacter rarus]|uniref:hypothetical protein n=1 Tax=Rodentibacter rarus TaxID=1908260 RepID=UPI000985D5DE|nr:hypothetical protein [Rodentibacter rarus]OOF42164.1 hypothetical protein BKK49_03270 [Rodentibacter rarus]